MGKDHDDFASLYAVLHQVMGQYRGGLEYLLVCEPALRRPACSRLHDAWPFGVLAGISGEDFVDWSFEIRPIKVCGGIGNLSFGEGGHGGVQWWGVWRGRCDCGRVGGDLEMAQLMRCLLAEKMRTIDSRGGSPCLCET